MVNKAITAGHTGKWHLGFGSSAHNDPWYDDHVVEGSLNVVEYPHYYRAGSSLPTDLGYEGDDFPGHGGGGHEYKQYQDYLLENNLTHTLKDPAKDCTEVVSPKESTIDYFLTERAIHFTDRFNRRKHPFFFALHYWGPHSPAYVPTEFYDRYREVELDPWPSFYEEQKEKPLVHNMVRGNTNWQTLSRKIKYTFAYSEFIDAEIGRLVKHLKESGIYDNSYIIITSDHGDSLGCHKGLGDKGFHMYEETTHIPLIIKPPKDMQCLKRNAHFVNTTDVYSTILAIAGVSPEEYKRDGDSLLGLMQKEHVPEWPDCVVTEFTGLGYSASSQRMIRFGDYKYVFNTGDREELYNIKEDPHELKNLDKSVEHQDTLRRIKKRLYDWLQEHNDRFAGHFLRYCRAAGKEFM